MSQCCPCFGAFGTSVPYTGLPGFVQHCHKTLKSQPDGTPLRIVMGNEAGDLDSMVCALVVAYHLSATSKKELYLPVMNVPRKDLALRRDNIAAFKMAKVNENSLIFAGELPLADLASQGKLSLVMVDHNELSPLQDELGNAVVQIIDHHKDSKLYPDVKSRIVEFPVGSCATLVTRLLQSDNAGLLAERPVNVLLQSTIAIDTKNLKDEKKTTELDCKMLGVLGTACNTGLDIARWEKDLKKQRQDIEGFSFAQVLRKDLKYSRACGPDPMLFAVSTVKASLQDQGLLDSANDLEKFLHEMGGSAKTEHLDGFFALCKAEEPKKHIVACAPTSVWINMQKTIGERLATGDAVYGGIAVKGSAISWPVYGNVKDLGDISFGLFEINDDASRKQVLPFLQDVLAKKREDCSSCLIF